MRWSLGIILLFIGQILCAQTLTQTIRGTVIDKDSKVPLPGVAVVVLNSDPLIGTTTDIDGNYRLEKVPVGFQHIKASFLGYEDQVIGNVLVESGHELILTIELVESFQQLNEVVVTGNDQKEQPINELSIVSTKPFSVEETQRYAGGFDDPSRMALSFAGVTGGNKDEQNEIIIRGNSPRGLMWMVEGVEVPTPNHFADNGSSDGAVSLLSNHMLANSDFSTGAFAPQYGNALSGVFDIKLRKGNNENHEFAFQASLLGIDAAMEGPFVKGKRSSYLANYRYSTLSLLEKMGLSVVNTGVPVFQDLSFKIYLPTKKAGNFSVWGIGGLSDILENEIGYINDSTQGELWRMKSGSNVGMIGITNNYIVSPKFYIQSSAAFTTQYIYNYRKELNESDVLDPFRHEDLYDNNTKLQVSFNNKINSRHYVKTGFIYTLNNYNLQGTYLDTANYQYTELLNAKGYTHIAQAYISWRYRITEFLKMVTGVHSMYHALSQNVAVEPRLSMQYDLPKKQSLSFGFGLHSRREANSIYLGQQRLPGGGYARQNKHLGLTHSLQYVLGYTNQLAPYLGMKVEVYYMQHLNVGIATDGSGFSMLNLSDGYVFAPLQNTGKGRNFGLELTLEKYFHQNYFMLITASVYEAFYTDASGAEHHSVYSNRFTFNMLGGKEFVVGKKQNNSLGMSARFILAGGRRYTPVDLAASEAAGTAIYASSDIYSKLTPTYYRFDLSLYFRRNRPRVNMLIKVDIQDLTNRTNIVDYTYSARQNRILTDYTGQLVPVIGYKLEF